MYEKNQIKNIKLIVEEGRPIWISAVRVCIAKIYTHPFFSFLNDAKLLIRCEYFAIFNLPKTSKDEANVKKIGEKWVSLPVRRLKAIDWERKMVRDEKKNLKRTLPSWYIRLQFLPLVPFVSTSTKFVFFTQDSYTKVPHMYFQRIGTIPSINHQKRLFFLQNILSYYYFSIISSLGFESLYRYFFFFLQPGNLT